MVDTPKPESIEDFKKSFSYGSRTDLNFKFLAQLSDDQAAKFFQDLLWKIGDAFDDGNFAEIVEHVCEWQKRAYFSADKKFTYDNGPFTPFQKRVSDSRLVLITSTGHFVEGKDPEPLQDQFLDGHPHLPLKPRVAARPTLPNATPILFRNYK